VKEEKEIVIETNQEVDVCPWELVKQEKEIVIETNQEVNVCP